MVKVSGDMAYTRRKYIRSIPQSKITRFTLGDTTSEYEYAVSLIAPKHFSVSSQALEAIRITTNKAMTNSLGEQSYRLKILTYPHEIMREHKFMGFAGADRLSQGMGHAFGRPTGRAARVKRGQKVITIFVNDEGIEAAKNALKRSSKKLPIKYTVLVEKIGKIQ